MNRPSPQTPGFHEPLAHEFPQAPEENQALLTCLCFVLVASKCLAPSARWRQMLSSRCWEKIFSILEWSFGWSHSGKCRTVTKKSNAAYASYGSARIRERSCRALARRSRAVFSWKRPVLGNDDLVIYRNVHRRWVRYKLANSALKSIIFSCLVWTKRSNKNSYKPGSREIALTPLKRSFQAQVCLKHKRFGSEAPNTARAAEATVKAKLSCPPSAGIVQCDRALVWNARGDTFGGYTKKSQAKA